MLLASIAIGVVIVALLWDLVLPSLKEAFERHRARRALIPGSAYDPGRERRAEQRARQLLQSCVNEEEWSMYRDLGFIRVWGALARAPRRGRLSEDPRAGAPYAYLVYPHKPIVAYLPQTGELLNEYCVEFPDESKPYGSARLPDLPGQQVSPLPKPGRRRFTSVPEVEGRSKRGVESPYIKGLAKRLHETLDVEGLVGASGQITSPSGSR